MIASRRPALATAAAAGTLLLAPAAMADFVPPTSYGWERGTPNTTHFQWEFFTSVAGPNVPDAARFPDPLPAGWATPNAWDSAPGSFVTGGGNIYNIAEPLSITATVPNYDQGSGYTTRVLLQVRTLGTEIDPASVNVNGVAPQGVQELSREPLGGFGGAIVDMLYYFEVPGNAALYTVRFDAAEGSMSLDKISVDTSAVAAGSCPADHDGNGQVNSSDLSAFITTWLHSVQTGSLAGDFNGDNAVNSSDLSAFISAWLLAVQNGGC